MIGSRSVSESGRRRSRQAPAGPRKGVLVRVGIDQTEGTGNWNGPVNATTNEFVYVPIREWFSVRRGMKKPFSALNAYLRIFKVALPKSVTSRHMHLDPDFQFLTYGDVRERAKQLRKLSPGDLVVFYAALRGIHNERRLVYAIIGVILIKRILFREDVEPADYKRNAHTRRQRGSDPGEVVITGTPNVSGRLATCIPIGEYRNRAYRVRRDLLKVWGGLTVKDGYLQRSARLPMLKNVTRFYRWFNAQNVPILSRNN